MNTEERLANLERELARAKRRNRRLVVFALVAAGVAVVAAAWIGAPRKVLAESGAKATNVIRASEFILEDADGNVRASLGISKDGSGLSLYDENGKTRVALGISKDSKGGPGLVLRDENGSFRAALGVAKVGATLDLWDKNGKLRAELGASATVTRDERTIIYPESSLHLFGPDQKVIWQAP